MKENFDPSRIIKALKTSRWTKIFFNVRGEAGAEGSVDLETMEMPASYLDTPVGKFKTVGEAFKGYGEANKLIGSKGVILPGENATEEETGKFYNSLGRPEKPEGYEFDKLENMHPEMKITPESEAGFKAFMHKHGQTAKQAKGIYGEFHSMMSTALTKRDEGTTATRHETEAALRTEWGAEYDNNLNQAKRLIEKYGGAEGREAFGDLGNNPAALKTIANISKKFSEDGFIKGNNIIESEAKDAKIKLDGIMMNQEHPYWKQGAGHTEAVQEVKRLQTILHPDVEATG